MTKKSIPESVRDMEWAQRQYGDHVVVEYERGDSEPMKFSRPLK